MPSALFRSLSNRVYCCRSRDYAELFALYTEFFDVKFYPYNPPGAPPVFAAVSKKHVSFILIRPGGETFLFYFLFYFTDASFVFGRGKKAVVCRLSQPKDKDNNPCEVIRIIRDDDVSAYFPTCKHVAYVVCLF